MSPYTETIDSIQRGYARIRRWSSDRDTRNRTNNQRDACSCSDRARGASSICIGGLCNPRRGIRRNPEGAEMALMQWVRLPSDWINCRDGLKELRWKGDGVGSDATAALMALTAIAHRANELSGIARLTYDALCSATCLSRAKLSNGLDVLESIHVIERMPDGRSTYKLLNLGDPSARWGKLPAESMYVAGRIEAFSEFRLRKAGEFNALKLFFLVVARRNQKTNMANLGYTGIEKYTGIERAKIKSAISLLAALSLIYVEHRPSDIDPRGVANAYRIVGVDSYRHMGTQGRGMTPHDFGEVEVPF